MNSHPKTRFRILRRYASASIPAPGEPAKETHIQNRLKVEEAKP